MFYDGGMTFSGRNQKTPDEDEGICFEGPDRDQAIKFERVCLQCQKRCSHTQYINKSVNASKKIS